MLYRRHGQCARVGVPQALWLAARISPMPNFADAECFYSSTWMACWVAWAPACSLALLTFSQGRRLCTAIATVHQSPARTCAEYFYSYVDGLLAGLGPGLPPARSLVHVVQAKGDGYALSTKDELQTVAVRTWQGRYGEVAICGGGGTGKGHGVLGGCRLSWWGWGTASLARCLHAPRCPQDAGSGVVLHPVHSG